MNKPEIILDDIEKNVYPLDKQYDYTVYNLILDLSANFKRLFQIYDFSDIKSIISSQFKDNDNYDIDIKMIGDLKDKDPYKIKIIIKDSNKICYDLTICKNDNDIKHSTNNYSLEKELYHKINNAILINYEDLLYRLDTLKEYTEEYDISIDCERLLAKQEFIHYDFKTYISLYSNKITATYDVLEYLQRIYGDKYIDYNSEYDKYVKVITEKMNQNKIKILNNIPVNKNRLNPLFRQIVLKNEEKEMTKTLKN